MTQPIIPRLPQQDLEGRSVRDVVENDPAQVNDAWCRKILHKILKSLELQYAMQMPHRAITPDTVVFHANGEPLLISDDIDADPAPDAYLADDLTALAHVIHFAITHELAPAGPLHGRDYDYSAALIATIDACMAPDPALRPRSVDAVRRLLDVVEPEPATSAPAFASPLPHQPSASYPANASTPAVAPASVEPALPDAHGEAQRAGTPGRQRWTRAAGYGAIAIALALVVFPELRDTRWYDHIMLTVPDTRNGAHPDLPMPGHAASGETVTIDARPNHAAIGASGNPASAAAAVTGHDAPGGAASSPADGLPENPASKLAESPAFGASSGGTTAGSDGIEQSDGVTSAMPHPARAVDGMAATNPPAVSARPAASLPANARGAAVARDAVTPSAVPGNASYQLQIKPWGIVEVDGVDRGVSPPVKRLSLTPGWHTIRITNPKYRDTILEFDSARTTSNGKIIVDFDHEAQ